MGFHPDPLVLALKCDNVGMMGIQIERKEGRIQEIFQSRVLHIPCYAT